MLSQVIYMTPSDNRSLTTYIICVHHDRTVHTHDSHVRLTQICFIWGWHIMEYRTCLATWIATCCPRKRSLGPCSKFPNAPRRRLQDPDQCRPRHLLHLLPPHLRHRRPSLSIRVSWDHVYNIRHEWWRIPYVFMWINGRWPPTVTRCDTSVVLRSIYMYVDQLLDIATNRERLTSFCSPVMGG